jgi:hypothetical protein
MSQFLSSAETLDLLCTNLPSKSPGKSIFYKVLGGVAMAGGIALGADLLNQTSPENYLLADKKYITWGTVATLGSLAGGFVSFMNGMEHTPQPGFTGDVFYHNRGFTRNPSGKERTNGGRVVPVEIGKVLPVSSNDLVLLNGVIPQMGRESLRYGERNLSCDYTGLDVLEMIDIGSREAREVPSWILGKVTAPTTINPVLFGYAAVEERIGHDDA